MNQYGWSLTADDVAQSYYGTYVDYNDLQPGDLVFFDEEGTGISHVGIYSGGGYLVHSSAYFGYVVESDMSYIYGYYTARRLY
jgi:cell wall-associated NlpC family hydrolase